MQIYLLAFLIVLAIVAGITLKVAVKQNPDYVHTQAYGWASRVLKRFVIMISIIVGLLLLCAVVLLLTR